jgi:hypothetical protein
MNEIFKTFKLVSEGISPTNSNICLCMRNNSMKLTAKKNTQDKHTGFDYNWPASNDFFYSLCISLQFIFKTLNQKKN